MDKHFLEFWGHFLLNAAQGQRQLEEMAALMGRGFNDFAGLATLFQKAYGLDNLGKESPDYLEQWEKAQADFRASFKDYLALMGVVPLEEYNILAKKCAELEEKLAEREQTIKQLQLLLEGREGYEAMTQGLQDLAQKQGEQFQELLQSFGELFKKEGAKAG